ncbi:DUF1566 domain-containing protein, partial [bacterium]|nr:DUF1566 domain-containing protein [bacterium]
AKTPNSYGTGKDIRGLNIAIKTGADIVIVGTTYSGVDCSDPNAEGYSYCNSNDITYADDIGTNYWVGAQYACAKQGMKLPTKDELKALYNDPDWAEKPTSGWFWSSSENSAYSAYNVDFDYGDVIGFNKLNQHSVVCIGN